MFEELMLRIPFVRPVEPEPLADVEPTSLALRAVPKRHWN